MRWNAGAHNALVSRVCLLMFEIICLTDAGATVAAKREKGFCVCV